ncbi:hypothetical protein NOR_05137 [Metarhizium rileyi]|uniref:Retrotransposon gag domain-containing protein n=1 Tax=Metarhizium rileyi (strain RCEF 4871) TaxID=1649241 RepID=A0A167CVM2_METRR|nr:hypothetical protein NOR_05137 [Metarhizium rileyi RCEF 4871]
MATPNSYQARLVALQKVVDGQAEQIHELTRRCVELSSRTPQNDYMPLAVPPPAGTAYQKRKPLLIGAPYDGDKANFPAWRSLISHKLRTDEQFIGDACKQWDFIFQNLSSKVQSQVAPFFKLDDSVNYKPTDFLDYLASMYTELHQEEMALTELDHMEQRGNESFADFLVRFENKMALAGCIDWPDALKLAKLRRSLNEQMQHRIIGAGVSRTSYPLAVERLRSVAVDIECYRLEKKFRKRRNGNSQR